MLRSNLPPEKLVHHQVEIGGQIRVACCRSPGTGAHH